MHVSAEALVDRIIPVVGTRLPAGVTADYFDSFARRNRTALVAMLDRQLAARGQRNRSGSSSRPGTSGDRYAEVYAQPPDLWAASQRTAANLAAMRLAARKRAEEMTAEDRATLAAYPGWGGLSIQDVAAQFPTGFPVPEERGLIHEYYTPTKVAREVARVIRPLLPELPEVDGAVVALEPSAGIGRFVQAASGAGFEERPGRRAMAGRRVVRAVEPDAPGAAAGPHGLQRPLRALGARTGRRQLVRLRAGVVERYQQATGVRLPDDEVVENVEGQGYRLNPTRVLARLA